MFIINYLNHAWSQQLYTLTLVTRCQVFSTNRSPCNCQKSLCAHARPWRHVSSHWASLNEANFSGNYLPVSRFAWRSADVWKSLFRSAWWGFKNLSCHIMSVHDGKNYCMTCDKLSSNKISWGYDQVLYNLCWAIVCDVVTRIACDISR